jgi:hypothetical protein
LAQKVNIYLIQSVYFENGKDKPITLINDNKLLTAECIWKSDTKTGDYHDNMNSEMFMNWVTKKLVQTFEAMYPGKRMILILDNAAYHHKGAVERLHPQRRLNFRLSVMISTLNISTYN